MEHEITSMRKDTLSRLNQRFDDMEKRIKGEAFWKTTRTTNTVNYWVFDYNPQQELIVRNRIANLQHNINKGNKDFSLIVIDLYDLVIEHLQKRGYLDMCERFEEEHDLEYLTAAVKNSLQITENRNAMVQYIAERIPDEQHAVVFLTGIGKCFPLLQGPEVFNQILYNMPEKYNNTPMILFYPGTYTEQELIIFNELTEDNYYRAYRIAR